jgi:CheY-like chemotaxis protein
MTGTADRGLTLRLLVVEDDADNAESLALLLRLDGHDVMVACDGPTALRMAEEYPPDVALLDLGLPGMDGYEVARRLVAQSPDRKPLLIAVTGYGRDTDRQHSTEAGIQMHLLKPVDPKMLQQLLGRFKAQLTA